MTFSAFRHDMCQEMIQSGVKRDSICQMLHMSSKTITKIRHENPNSPPPRPRGRPPRVTEEMLRFIDANWSADASISDDGMKDMVNEVANFVKNRWACLCQKSRNRKHRDHQPLPPIFELDSDLESWTNLFDEWLK